MFCYLFLIIALKFRNFQIFTMTPHFCSIKSEMEILLLKQKYFFVFEKYSVSQKLKKMKISLTELQHQKSLKRSSFKKLKKKCRETKQIQELCSLIAIETPINKEKWMEVAENQNHQLSENTLNLIFVLHFHRKKLLKNAFQSFKKNSLFYFK